MSNPYGPRWPQQPAGGQQWPGQPQYAGQSQYAGPAGQPWPGHPGTGGGEPGFTVPPPRQRRSPWLWISSVAGGLVVVVVLVTGFVAPGFFVRTTFDAQAVQQGVRQTLEGAYGISGVESVTCPSGKRVEPTSMFDCEATVAGSTLTVPITVKHSDGTYEVGHPR